MFREHGDRLAGTGLMELTEMTDPHVISEAELIKAARKIPTRKAPRLDGVPGLAIKTTALIALDLFRRTFDACLQEGYFPTEWKLQRLVLLPKGNCSGSDK